MMPRLSDPICEHCGGTGFEYPNGYSGGVKKCRCRVAVAQQAGLPTIDPAPRKIRKRQRATACASYDELRDVLTDHQERVLRAVAAYWNRTQTTPTARELYADMVDRGVLISGVDDINSVRPRLNELEALGLIVAATPRECTITTKTVHTWKVREAGA